MSLQIANLSDKCYLCGRKLTENEKNRFILPVALPSGICDCNCTEYQLQGRRKPSSLRRPLLSRPLRDERIAHRPLLRPQDRLDGR
ncbi:MAG: hypothetical protein J5699_05805 [Bacteroidales bacterium]|nr:hypothetical protein [Bacteroidales bacterium]